MPDQIVIATEALLRAAAKLNDRYVTPLRGCVDHLNVVKPNGRYVVVSDKSHTGGQGVILNSNIEDALNQIIMWRWPEGEGFEKHFYPVGKTVIMLSGEMTIKTTYGTHRLCGENNDTLYIPAGLPHSGTAITSVEQIVIFEPKLSLNIMDKQPDDRELALQRAIA